MKYPKILIIFALMLSSCQFGSYSEPPQLEIAINSSGIVENYRYNKLSPKVVTYFGGVPYFEDWLVNDMPVELLNQTTEKYKEFEFLFYLKVKSGDELDNAIEIVKKHNMENPVYIVQKDELAGTNIGGDKMILVTYIYGENNKPYLSGILGTRFSPKFETSIQNAIEQIKLDNNGL